MQLRKLLGFQRFESHATMSNVFLRRMSKMLRLDERQEAKLNALQSSLLTTRANMTDVRRERNAMFATMLRENQFDRDQAMKLLSIPRQEFNEQLSEMVDAFAYFYNSLEDQQQAKLIALWQKHQSHRRWH